MRPGYLFLQFWPPNGSLRGGSTKSLFRSFFESWAVLGTPGVKMVPRASLWHHFAPILGPIRHKHTKKCDLQWETKPNIYTKTSERFWKLASVSSCFSLYLGWFCVQSTAHEGMEAQGGIGRPRSVFENWRAFRLVFHYILWLILWLSWARWRVGRRQLDKFPYKTLPNSKPCPII